MSAVDNEGVLALVRDPEIPQGISNLMEPLESLDWPADDLNSPLQSLLDDLLSDYTNAGADTGKDSSTLSKTELLAELLHQICSQRTDFLAQLWVPVLRNARLMLTTQDQPYAVQPSRADLVRYRALSARYVFPAQRTPERERELYPGLPGRVFSALSPEWSPNVQHHHCTDFLRVRDAARCNVRGTLAVPVIEPRSRECLAVLELVSTAEKLEYDDELSLVTRSLQALNLSSWSRDDGAWMLPEVLQELGDKFVGLLGPGPSLAPVDSHDGCLSSKVPLTRGREAVFLELDEVLRVVCETHKLPMAQTWIPYHGDSGFLSLYTGNSPAYVRDPRLRGFRQACCEQRLEIGQGVPGRAFTTNEPSFKAEVQSFSREEYPLLHFARCFRIGAAAAIRLRSSVTGTDDYIVEFILPEDCGDAQEFLRSLSGTMQRVCKSLRTMSKQELVVMDPGVDSPPSPPARIGEFLELEETSSVVDSRSDRHHKQHQEISTTQSGPKRKKVKYEDLPGPYAAPEKKRASNEKTVALEVLQQHFAGSLRDAAKSIGVCPTTLKRICRQYGISRWPSRKINKVNRSLMKLQGVIESVEGVDRKVKLDSLTGELASTAAATAALTTKRDTSLPGGASVPWIPGADGVNVFQEPEQETQVTGTTSWENFTIKIEPRVHGSSEALSYLEAQLSLPHQSAEAAQVDQKVKPCIDWAALRSRTSNDASLNCFRTIQARNNASSSPNSFKDQLLTIKATMGSDTVRFKLSPGFGFDTLKEEVANRFRLEVETFSLKYMDDDSEWVLLNGDNDLAECIDVMESGHFRVIKLVVHVKGGAGCIGSPSFSSVNS